MLKKGIKVFAGIVIFFVMSLLILALVIKYEISWRITDIETKTSPDGRYSILFQSIGEADFPFGSSHAKVTVKDGDKVIESFKEDIADDGGAFRPDNYKVEWMPVGVVITFRGSEQADHEVLIFYDGRESFEGYTDKEIEEILKSRYKFDEIERIIPKADGYEVRANGIDFYADKTLSFHDSYLQEYVKTMTDDVFPELVQRSISWEKQTGDSPAEVVYTPVISMDGLGNQDLEAFSEDICRWLEYCFDRLPYEEGKTAYTGFIPEIPGYQNTKYYFSEYSLENFEGNHTDFYNSLYTYLNRYINHEYDALFNISGNDSSTYDMDSSDDGILEVSEDNIKIWSSYEPAAVYDFPDGTEYALVAVDRALGSSFYVLLSYGKKGEPDSAQLVTDDPFNGSTGEAKFITFLDDQKTGFAALTYNGGCEGMLFITRDKGATFSYVNLPSPEILLPNGQKYNPFVMPEEVWEESGKIYLKIGQGPEGDHYSEELGGKTAGIYVSDNDGRSFEFVKEELVEE